MAFPSLSTCFLNWSDCRIWSLRPSRPTVLCLPTDFCSFSEKRFRTSVKSGAENPGTDCVFLTFLASENSFSMLFSMLPTIFGSSTRPFPRASLTHF